MSQVHMFLWELETGFKMLNDVLEEITKEEAQWKPTKHTMTLDTLIQWNTRGSEWLKSQKFDPISTIEHKVVHLAQCKRMYDEYAFRNGALTWSELEASEWPQCIADLEMAQARLMESIDNIPDEFLEDLVPTNWGDLWPIKSIIFTMIHHDAYHLGQICTVRNFFRIQNK